MQTISDPAWLYGADPTPGIVGVWADWRGQALVWRRTAQGLLLEKETFTPWVYADHLTDLKLSGMPFAKASEERLEGQITYLELPGGPGSSRFLLQCTDGRILRNALLQGASRRLGKKVSHLSDLWECYTMAPLEQYLMLTGRTYFKGLRYEDLHRMQIDLETTSLSPEDGHIFLISVKDNQGLEVVLEDKSEKALLESLTRLIQQRNPDVIENHNLMGFDLPFLMRRAEQLGLKLLWGRDPGPLEVVAIRYQDFTRYSVAGREMIDTLDAVRRHQFVTRDMASQRLKDVAKYFGVASPERVYIAGEKIYQTYLSDPEQVRHYALDDVREVSAISERLMQPAFALSQMAPRSFERVAYAGTATGILEPMLVRAYLQEKQALPCSQHMASDTPHEGGAVYLFQTGVARNVVKADISSLYPSIMRQYQIGPRCDTLGVMTTLVDQLTALRLEHKEQAKKASQEAPYHNAIQAAMKLVINSAYGYLGAGKMARFADRNAADQITALGREILQQVLHELQARGMTLIEADTDGVFFSMPEHWTEQQGRQLVAEVSATLPELIHLDFEGWYPAMFSHQVKNYALLTAQGKLVLRGASLHSIRSEAFGSQFLKEALMALLQGDVEGVHHAFTETVEKLRARAFKTRDVAMRIRLTKSSQQYLHRRSDRKESPYEAMLLSGRESWSKGERILMYQGRGRIGRILQDQDPRDYDIQHYIEALKKHYAERLSSAFSPEDFEAVFPAHLQGRLFERTLEEVQIQHVPYGQEI
ncbi:DNA polymerase domain-containing protein [Deinococcus roseus]|uniref:DNA-directed DNA polymerase n=1 Tax=Deinococcus roseus TaxID=392414 RepID=A0ABQ2CX45_9DEIO|nr:DNA polymerase domain-containing protein [Deinococcus roseus]GGJ29720.1 DNA polymerase [Deinococcus roseus]